eukprot:COSAG01_NODE_4432_length_5031_cov_3.848540_1_plen_82_part_10
MWHWDQHYWRARCKDGSGGGGHAVAPAVAAQFWAEFVPAVVAAAAAANAEDEVTENASSDGSDRVPSESLTPTLQLQYRLMI